MIVQFISILSSLLLQAPSSKTLVYENHVYEPEIKTVQLYGMKNDPRTALLPAVASIRQNDLVLEFDDLRYDQESYYARLIHCNYDWTPSRLRDLDFMNEYNEFVINDYAFSSNTSTPYVHYKFKVPNVKLPGNYLLVVYRDGNKSDLVLSHRFMAYENQVSMIQDNQSIGSINLRLTNQQLNFTINYKGLEMVNPLESVHVVIRQNQRWDNAKFNIRPSFVREDRKQIEYRFFDDDKYFSAGNEFRFVDFRSINFPGQNTDRIEKATKPFHIWVQKDKSRLNQPYAQYLDLNGQYYIENLDYNNEPDITSDYVDVTMTLVSVPLQNAKVYTVGSFNYYERKSGNEMKYNTSLSAYEFTARLKQGWYDYQYLVVADQQPPYYFEGSHYEAENFYEILVYYKPFQPAADMLIGYFPIAINPR